MSPSELAELVAAVQQRGTELDSVEVKSAHRGTPRNVYQSLSAFANSTDGGTMVFGLDEEHGFSIVGVADAQRLQEEIGHVASRMQPCLRPEFTVEVFTEGTVVAVEVPSTPAQSRPCYYGPRGLQEGSFIRVGNTNRRMTDYEIFGYVSARAQPTFDEEPVQTACREDLDPRRVDAYLADLRDSRPDAAYLRQPRRAVMERLGIAREVDGSLRPTLAGLLAFGEHPQAYEPQLMITFLQFYGTTEQEATPRGERFLDNRKFEGPVPDMVESAVRHVMASVRKSSLIEGMYRRDIPEYPERAVREAVVNATAHRDYSPQARGSYIQLRLFADRLEVQSPGGLYGNVTEETLETEHSTRNRVLMRLMEDLHIAENRGSGITTMIEAMREAALEPPRFRDRRTSFCVTFRNHSLMSPDTVSWLNQFSGHPLNDRQRVALAYLRGNAHMTNSDYQRLNHVDSVTATREFRGLVQTGLIAQHGTRGGARYVLGVPAGRPEPSPAATSEERVLAYVRENGAISNSQCQQLLGLQRHQAYAMLQRMASAGVLRLIGTKRGSRYVLARE